MTKKKKQEKSETLLELVGGIYVVERFPDGRESRSEIDGKLVLELLMMHLESALEIEYSKLKK